ncbi:MAG: nucleoside hydrolase [Clostridia bacterium]|nr:nucleoside hydrolase [Clostridia bacterium]
MRKLPVIIDTDPGTDDAVALFVAKTLDVNVHTIVSVCGNVNGSYTHKNVVDLNGFLSLDANIIKGADKPLSGSGFTAEEVHGENGIGGVILPEAKDNAGHISQLYDTLIKLGKADIITLGPLTNIAYILREHPEAKENINSITVMGGGFEISNIPNNAEFNFGCDPMAAQIVLFSGIDITIVPLDVTHKVYLTKEELEYICGFEMDKTDNSVVGVMSEIMYYNYKTAIAKQDQGALIHDATAVIQYLYPELFDGVCGTVTVDGYGATTFKEGGNIKVVFNVKRDLVIEKLKFCFTKGH